MRLRPQRIGPAGREFGVDSSGPTCRTELSPEKKGKEEKQKNINKANYHGTQGFPRDSVLGGAPGIHLKFQRA